jgi:hypothetical protein
VFQEVPLRAEVNVVEQHMTVKELERLYDYGYWANRKLFQMQRSAAHWRGETEKTRQAQRRSGQGSVQAGYISFAACSRARFGQAVQRGSWQFSRRATSNHE